MSRVRPCVHRTPVRLPDLDDGARPFPIRWNTLCRTILVDPSVKHIARAAIDFADEHNRCSPSNSQLARETGLSERTVRTSWAVMRGLGMAQRTSEAVPYQGLADEYQLRIPDGWRSLPLLGPHAQDFTCLACVRPFTPQGNCTVNPQPGDRRGRAQVRFDLSKMVFCPGPRGSGGRAEAACREVWDRREANAGRAPWGNLNADQAWRWFRQARRDDWLILSPLTLTTPLCWWTPRR